MKQIALAITCGLALALPAALLPTVIMQRQWNLVAQQYQQRVDARRLEEQQQQRVLEHQQRLEREHCLEQQQQCVLEVRRRSEEQRRLEEWQQQQQESGLCEGDCMLLNPPNGGLATIVPKDQQRLEARRLEEQQQQQVQRWLEQQRLEACSLRCKECFKLYESRHCF
jgi:hypothetical protein